MEETEPCVWVEYYPSPADGAPLKGRPSFDRVTFATWRPSVVWLGGVRRVRLGEPHWKHLPADELAALIGDARILEY